MNIGNNIKKLRLCKQITQEVLAKALGVSSQAVSKWETGTNAPDISMLPQIADFFGTSIDFLFREENVFATIKSEYIKDDDVYRIVLTRGLQVIKATYETDKPFEIVLPDDKDVNIEVFGHMDCSSISGNVISHQYLVSNSIGGNVVSHQYIESNSIGGHASCDQYIECNSIGGHATCRGNIECDSIGGNIKYANSITCGDINGNVACDGNISAHNITCNGEIICSGNINCDGGLSCEKITYSK